MEIKVRCVCGSLYSFEEEPVDGRLKFPVSCTNCGADGTEQANAYIAAKLNGGPDPTASRKSRGLLGLLKGKTASSDPDEMAEAPKGIDGDIKRLALATVAALAVGAAGAFGWLWLAKATGMEFGFVAWALGGFVGLTARLLAPRGHHWLGWIGAAASLVAIGGGELLTAKWGIDQLSQTFVASACEQAGEYAASAAEATTDDELRRPAAHYKLATLVAGENPAGVLATYRHFQLADSFLVIGHIIERDRPLVVFAEQGKASDESRVTPGELASFKTKVLPELQKFANGEPSEEEYRASLEQLVSSRVTLKSLVLASMGPYSWIWVFLGVATAYKVASKT